MLHVLERLGVTDERILKAHYLRGLNYAFGAIYDDGWDNPLVKERTREVFSLMRPELVAEIPNLAPHRKEFFFDVRGLPCPKFSRAPWRRHLVAQVGRTLKDEGVAGVLKRVRRALAPEEPSRA